MKEPYRITEEDFPEFEVLSVRTRDALGAMGKYIGSLYGQAGRNGLKPAGPIFSVYYEKPTNPASVDYEMFLPVEGPSEKLDKLQDFGGDPCLKARHTGSYASLSDAYAALEAEVAKRGLSMSGPPREVYVRGPLLGFLSFIPTMVTDIYFPVKHA
jgi:effector-binding domain-containing protein